MTQLVVFGVGSFGQALMDSACAIGGLQQDGQTFVLDGSDIHAFRHALTSICGTIFRNDYLVLLCDAQNSPLVKEAWLVLEKKGLMNKVVFLAGANVPCLMSAMVYKDELASRQLAQSLQAQAKSGVLLLGS